jgi:hypothetical protein
MARSYSLVRRSPSSVDIRINQRSDVQSYIFKSSANFDGTYVDTQIVPFNGFKSLTADISTFDSSATSRGQSRFYFNPDDYTLSQSYISNTSTFWLKLAEVKNGVEQAAGPAHMVLPYNSNPERIVTIAGTAPSAVSITGSLEIQLPGQCVGFKINNNGSNPVMVAFEKNGPEFTVSPQSTSPEGLSALFSSVHQIFVRGAGGSSAFSSIFSQRSGKSLDCLKVLINY